MNKLEKIVETTRLGVRLVATGAITVGGAAGFANSIYSVGSAFKSGDGYLLGGAMGTGIITALLTYMGYKGFKSVIKHLPEDIRYIRGKSEQNNDGART